MKTLRFIMHTFFYITLIGIVVLNTYYSPSPKPNTLNVLGSTDEQSFEQLTEKLLYWQKIITTHPSYRDAYIQVGIIYYQLGNFIKSKEMFLHAQILDPNNEQVSMYLEVLAKK